MRKLICTLTLVGAGTLALPLAAALPTEYQQLEYIQANGQCRIKTGVTPAYNDKVEMTWMPTTVSGNQNLWCARTATSKQFTGFMIGATFRFDRNEGTAGQKASAAVFVANTRYSIVADYGAGVSTISNDVTHTEETTVSNTTDSYTVGSELAIFASHNNNIDDGLNNYGSYRLYSFRLRNSSGTLRLDLVPAKRLSDNVIGVYDTVNNAFLTNDLSGCFTTSGMTITPSAPEWGKALTVASDTVIDAGLGATWSGALTVFEGATLTTRGNLTVSGTTTVNVNGTLDIETGTAYFSFGNKTMSGNLIIRQGAQLDINRSDSCYYHAAFAIHVYGTFNAQTFRTSVGVEDTVYLHDGARVIGKGDGNGAFDLFDSGCRLVVDGDVMCEAPLRARDKNENLIVACFENTRFNLAGGFAGSHGNMVQTAATADDGNAAGTCANAFIEVGVSPSMDGKLIFVSKAAVALKGATQTFTVETSAPEIAFRADADVARANHALVQKLPVITNSTAAVRLVGEGVCAFFDAAPTFQVVFAGASLAIATNAPVALAAGSSVISNTTIAVEGLTAETAATLLTGVDSSFDVSKVFAQAMHNGVPLGTPAATSLDGASTVVTTGVAAYDAAAWIAPYLKAKALIWLDASDAVNFVFKDKTFGYVTLWRDLSSYGRTATSYMANYGSLGVADGVPAYLMGAVGAQIDMNFTRITGIRTVFQAMAIRSTSGGFNQWLGDDTACHFHRNTDGSYDSQWGMQNCSFYKDGELVAAPRTTVPPSDRHIYTIVTSAGAQSNQLSRDRTTNARSSGRDLSELIVLDEVLSEADRQAIEAYLAAKWMGADATAAAADNTYTFRSELVVDGTISGTQNLAFSEEASITISNPPADGAMVSTTGSVTIPAGTTLAVDVDARALPLGTYTVIDAADGITSASQFAATAQTAPGAEAAFSVVDGKLVMTVAQAASATTSLMWRPEDASDLAWNSANWLYSDGVTKGPFVGYLATSFDGGESVSGNIAVNDTYSVGPMSITGTGDYNFTGTGTLAGSDPIVIDTTGTVSLSGPNLGDQDIVVSNGTLRLGPNAGGYALGTSAGKIKLDGGTLDINTPANTTARSAISHRKDIELLRGGSIVNTGSAEPSQGSFSKITVEGSGTLGGSQRFDVRVNAADPDRATSTISGDTNAVLNVDTTKFLVFHNVAANIGRINVLGGMLQIEQTGGEYNVPHGIHVADGAGLRLYQAVVTTGAVVNVDSGTAQISAQSGTSTVKSPLAVAAGATAELVGTATVDYEGGVQNAGTVRTTAGTHILKGDIAGSSYEVAGGQMRLAGAVQESSLTIPVTSSSLYVKDGMTAETITAKVTGGDAGLLLESAVAPVFEAYNLNLGGNSSYILPRVAGQIVDLAGTVNIDQADAGTTYVYSTTNNNEFGVAMKMTGSVGSLRVGLNNGRAGTLQLKQGSDVSVKFLATADGGAAASRGRIIIDSGAKVTIRNGGDVRVGHWSTAPTSAQTHTIDVAGELDCSAGTVYCTMDAPRGEMYLREGGVLKTKGFVANRSGRGTTAPNATHTFGYGNGTGAADGRHWFMMEGGRLEIGSAGVLGACIPGVTRFDFRNGDMVNVAAWGTDYGIPMFFGHDLPGGRVAFDLGSHLVNWHTGLSGASDVTLKGSANFQGDRRSDRMQGAMLGKLTVENTGANDLRNASAFAGGLTLAPGVNAQVAKYGDARYAYAVAGIGLLDHVAGSGWSYPFVSANFFPFAYTKFTTSPIAGNTVVAGRGEFYVSAEKAGKWTFAGNYDDYIRLDVDGTQVFKTTSWSQVGRGTMVLAEGWHKFTLAVYDGGKPGGPSADGWGGGKGLGVFVGETTATAAGNYVKFADGEDFGDGTKLQVRPCAKAAVWSHCSAGYADWSEREDWASIKCVDTLEAMYKCNTSSDAGSWKTYVWGKANKFEGWFRVEDDKTGDWAFSLCYDDFSLFKIDGVEVARSMEWNVPATCSVNLTAGWHRWEVRVAESGGGGWGPASSVNGGHTLRFTAPGETEAKRFDETNLRLAATLGDIAVLEPSGIYNDLELGADATLTSSGTLPMPIYGTLKGTGSLAGSWEFAGDHNCWEVTNAVAKAETLPVATFAAATPATFAGLKNVKVTFNARPTRSAYYLTGVINGLTDADLPDATMTVMDADDNDYSANFTLTVKGGRLAIGNSKPAGITILIR